MAQCPSCAQMLMNPNARFCNHCGAQVGLVATMLAATPQPASVATRALPQALRYVQPIFDVQLTDAPRGEKIPYYAAHIETYAVINEQDGWYELRLGGGRSGWLKAKHCENSQKGASSLSVPIPSVLHNNGTHYVWATFEPMPLAQIAYDSNDYSLMYQWIGALSSNPPTITGYVRNVQQVQSRTISGASSYRVSDTQSNSVGYSTTTHTYQMLIEDRIGARRTVVFEQPPVTFLPQVGDYLVVWANDDQNGVYSLRQGIRRDLHDPSSGSVLIKLGVVELKTAPTNWLMVIVVCGIVLYLLLTIIRFLNS